MADPQLVADVVEWLTDQWDLSNYPGYGDAGLYGAGLYGDGLYGTGTEDDLEGQMPAIINGDDAESVDFKSRKLKFDPRRNNAVIVNSSPNRQQEAVGTEFDYRFTDGVSIRIAGLHESKHGHLSGSLEFRALVAEVRRIIHSNRTYPAIGGANQHGLDARIEDETNLSSQYRDWHEYDMTVLVRGHEALP